MDRGAIFGNTISPGVATRYCGTNDGAGGDTKKTDMYFVHTPYIRCDCDA